MIGYFHFLTVYILVVTFGLLPYEPYEPNEPNELLGVEYGAYVPSA
jgi:hypothetical protein